MAVAQQQQQPLLPLNWCVIYSSVSHHHMRRQSLESYTLIMLSAAVVRNIHSVNLEPDRAAISGRAATCSSNNE